jgi:alkylation response protein AidB-like acyl-CoA dehydrogenase
MDRLAQTEGLTETQRDILATVRHFVDREILPVATELEHSDIHPAQIVEGMRKLGLFGLTIPVAYGGLGERPSCRPLPPELGDLVVVD